MPGLLETAPLDLRQAVARLRELRERLRRLALLALVLCLGGCGLLAAGHNFGVPVLIGAAAAAALSGLRLSDRRRLLLALVAQGDAGRLEEVAAAAERMRGARERRRLARGLRAAAAAGRSAAQVPVMVDPARAADVGERLLALADRFADPVANVSAQPVAICRRLLCDAQHSPLYNPGIPEVDLVRVLDLIERETAPPVS